MTIAEQEREKYRRMWEVPGYREKSPGELLVPTFLEHAEWDKGETLIDLGCGSGRAGLALSKAGLNVILMDITHQSLDDSVRDTLPFIEYCLWEPMTFKFDWAYCCDVLEHIPTEHVDAVLDNIAHMGFWGAFLQIALWPEKWGDKIGETLHLTVKPAQWWIDKIEKRWPIEWTETSDDQRLIVLTGAPW